MGVRSDRHAGYVEKVWTGAGMRDELHRSGSPSRAPTKAARAAPSLLSIGQEHQTRRCDNTDGRRREARHPDAVRMPNGHLPILCLAAGIRATCAISGLEPNTARATESRRASPQHPATAPSTFRTTFRAHGHHRHQPVRTPHRGRHRRIGPLSDFVLDQHLPIPAEQGAATSLFEASIINQAVEPSSARATRPSKPSGTSSLRVPTPVSGGTPSACASWPGPMRGSRSSGVASVRLGTQPVRDEVSRPPLISQSSSSRRTRR